ncbi:hypothetical protein Avbf_05591 [Armadillidium vulgare]|nr:hypothetical protein Avbf_05591 [Armadillidium vulgare]
MTALKCTFIVQSAKKTHTSEDNRDTKMVCCDTICTNYFITFNLKEKIEKFLTVNASNIKCTRSNDNIIRDIFDGEVYKELSKTGFDPEKDLTFNFSLDGAPLSKSSTLQAWPIFITINEIDLKFRFKNIFTAGFWISSSQMTNDLNIKNLLTVFVNKMKILQNTGYSSCNYCEIHGIYESNAVRFPYGNNVQLRTKKEWQKCARIAMNTNKAAKGIKGCSPLTDLQGFNIIWGAPPDYMHIILLGVMKTLFELYFTNTGNPWYIGSPKQRSLLDKKLFEMKVPNYINRKPRSVSKWKFWKATEFGNFLYYYIFILENVLPVEYYNHILHLRAGLMLLLKRAVAKDDVIKANEHFHNFVCYFEILFGVQYSTFNIHMLLHLSQSVKKCGPLWGFSAFPFENNLRIFRTLITGSKIPTKQVVKKVKVIQFLNMISHENINKEVLKFCEINYNVGYSISKLDRPLKVGKPLEVTFPWDNYTEGEALAIQSLNISNKIILYGNIKFSHFTVDTKNNNTLFLVDGKVGRVTKIFKNSESLYLLFQEYKVAMDYSGTIWKLINTTPANSNEECLKEDDQANLEKYERSIYEGHNFISWGSDGDGEVYLPKRKVNPLQETKIKEKEIIFGSISFPEKPFLTISRRPKHSLFVKDLVSLLWSEEDLSQRSLTGKKHYNSKEIKQPLTPEKRFAIEEAFKDRLKKQQYHDATIALELKLVNRYIAEKINDVKEV